MTSLILSSPMPKCQMIACPSFTILSRATRRDFTQSNSPWLRTCQFVESPVNYSESDSDSSEIYCCKISCKICPSNSMSMLGIGW